VVTTHRILAAQIDAIVRGWELAPSDRILHALPLHHLHGILNALCAVLVAGGSCELLARFEAEHVMSALASDAALSLFMGVPTMYARLAQRWDASSAAEQAAFTAGCKRMRLLVSGSAALPVAMLDRFRAISGHTLLERYGMSELGMALGNPLHGERRAGSVGVPFPGVEVRLVNERGEPVPDGEPGEIQVRGPNVFREYFDRPDATREAFTSDGFFRTGDVAVRERGMHRILGRESVDILKTGGFKVSALEIEDVLRTHEAISDCAVVGVPDEEWGQRVAVAVELRAGAALDPSSLREWGKLRMAPYKVPTLLHVTTALPRNALGKVQKPDVLKLFQGSKP
jgi:malonyl-CoA/methylmalonyl-CoA synthetase